MRLITTMQITSAALLAAALSLPIAAWAQTTTAPEATTAPAAPAPATHAPAAGETAASPAPITPETSVSRRERVEARIADMYATLHITRAEEKQWSRFAQVMLDNAKGMDDLLNRNASMTAKRSALQTMQSYDEVAQLHAHNVRRLSTAFKSLYATLTADQKQAADEMFRARPAEQKKGG